MSVFDTIVRVPLTIERVVGNFICDYCGQLHSEDGFLGGCKSCGAPAPRLMNNAPRYQVIETEYQSMEMLCIKP